MIYCLTGKIVKKSMGAVVLSCGGVGYYAQCPASVAGALPGVGKEATLYTVMSVTENDVMPCLSHLHLAQVLVRQINEIPLGADGRGGFGHRSCPLLFLKAAMCRPALDKYLLIRNHNYRTLEQPFHG